MVKRILFLTTANLTTNPRLFKELNFFQDKYDCHFLGFKLGNWSDALDQQHQQGLPSVNFHYISATREPYLPWLKSSVVHVIARKIYPLIKRSIKISAIASDKRAFLIRHYLSKHKGKYDLVIAHNLGTLYPAWDLARRDNTPFAFDIEDYHPGEKINEDIKNEQSRRVFMLKKLLPDSSYVSYASPLIGQYSIDLIGREMIKKHLLINNSFLSKEFICQSKVNGKLKLVWFSQYIDAGRGLEMLLSVLDKYSEQIELHLIGNPRDHFVEKYIKNRQYINLQGTMAQQDLHDVLSQFDIGLALESIEQDQNRDICLTNKIWAYTQAGLFVIATNTSAQLQFINKNPWVGSIVEQNKKMIDLKVNWLLDNIELIRKERTGRFNKAKDLSWEKEGEKLRKVIADVLK